MLIQILPCAAQNVELVEELNPAERGTGPTFIISYLGQLYFRADSGSAGMELMRYDGTNVSLAADINPSGSSDPTEFTANAGVLYFTADDGTHGQRLWSFDGSAASLVDSNQFVQTAQELISFNDNLYFRGTRFSDIGIELWRFDGSAISYIDILAGTGSSYPQQPLSPVDSKHKNAP
jgi:ELWxxDGT repeat protein